MNGRPHGGTPQRARVLPALVVLCASALFAAALAPGSAQAAPPGTTPDLTVTPWASDISDPWDIAFLPDGDALVTSKTTGVVHVRRTSGASTEVAADRSDFRASGEGGLMGIAVDPHFSRNGRYYTCQNSTHNDVRVVRWKLNAAKTRATRQATLVDDIPMSSGRHSGCRLAFGYEGYLWVTTGDAAIGRTPQNLRSLGGKVLRIDPTTGRGHRDNPFYTTRNADRSKVYSYGHRNPQGLGRRVCTNQMWTAEHGPSVDDEINLIVRGGNYGWNPVPGYNEAVPMTDSGLPGPQVRAKWSSGAPTIALSGIGWIRGADWGGWDGELAGATLKNAELWVFEFSNKNKLTDTDRPREFSGAYGRLRVPVMGPDGALYVASQSDGTVYRAVPDRGRATGDQDLNGDGFDDLVVGAPGDTFRGLEGAGSFNVLYGSAQGLRGGHGAELRDQGDIKGATAEQGDALATSLAYGDTDGDGTTDVVVGAPGETVSGAAAAGAVHMICGRTNGVEARSSQSFGEAGSVAGKREPGDRFGEAVVMGDFNGDGFDDMASGAPSEDVGRKANAGAVTVLYGGPAGVTTERSVQFSQAGPVAGSPRPNDAFGTALASGDFDADGFEDLAVGVPGDRRDGVRGAGSVVVFSGSPRGLRKDASRLIDQLTTPSDNASGDNFGATLTAADFNNDGRADLAVGATGERLPGISGTGEVTILFGGSSGLSGAAATAVNEVGLARGSGGGTFGAALAAGDINGDGHDDLVVGNPEHNQRSGRLVWFAGSASGPSSSGLVISQAGRVPGRQRSGHGFGATVRLADFDDDGHQDVAVGVPGETVKGRSSAGAIVVLPGSAAGLSPDDALRFTRSTKGVPGRPGTGDRWGAAL